MIKGLEKAIIRCISLWKCDASVSLQICQLSVLFRDSENPLEMFDSSRKPTPNIETHTFFLVHQSHDSLSTSQQSSHHSRENPLFHGALFADNQAKWRQSSLGGASHEFAVKMFHGNAMTLSANCLQDFFRTAAMAQLVRLRISPLNSWCYSWILFMQMFVAPDIKEGKDPGRSWLFLPTFLVDGTSDDHDPNMGSFRLISGWRYSIGH